MTSLLECFRLHYNRNILLSPFQAQTIGSAILSRMPGCNLLVFGLGNDTALWLSLNATGRTQFLESSPDWIHRTKQRHPTLAVALMPTFDLTVARSMSLGPPDFARFPVPPELTRTAWDVILVDGPPGDTPTDPGRAPAIAWAAILARPHTHIFIDDYDRPLERKLSDMLILSKRNTCSIAIPANDSVRNRILLWSAGHPRKN